MPKSLRLGPDLEKALDRYCAGTGEAASAVIRPGVAEYIVRRQRRRPAPSAWDLGKDLVGVDRSPAGQGNVSGRVKTLIRGRLGANITVDSGSLVELFHARDRHHQAAKAILESNPAVLASTWPVVTEACCTTDS